MENWLKRKVFGHTISSGNYFFHCKINFLLLWQEISWYLKKVFLWQEISYCGKKFLSVARHFFLRKMSVCDNTFALENLFFLQESICLTGTFASFCWKHFPVKFVTKMREFLPTFHVSLNISWEPGSLVPREYPTLLRDEISYTAILDYLDKYHSIFKTFILDYHRQTSKTIITPRNLFLLYTTGHFTVNSSYSYNKRSNHLYNYIKNNEKSWT